MSFNSLTYLVFLAIAVPLVMYSPFALRRAVLLLGSLMFYAFWRVDFTLLVVFSALVDYLSAWRIHASTNERVRTAFLALSLTINLGLLIFFKYTYFLVGTTQGILSVMGIPVDIKIPSIILPLGISFYTFQTISYTIDVYRRQLQPVRDFSLFLTYVMFWPQLIAGPILRAHEVLPQLQNQRRATAPEVARGLEEILHGLFKKVVLADTLAKIVDPGFAEPWTSLGTLDAWTLVFAFGLQVYFDFSGYSQIAIGSARILGFNFPQNFRWPYLAVSPRDFWKRWHISLSAWIRDYLYLPLQGARFRGASTGGIEANAAPEAISETRKNVALLLTWVIMGLWHGAGWKFALWGVWLAGGIFIYRWTKDWFGFLPAPMRILGGWLFSTYVIMGSFPLFRAQEYSQVWGMMYRMHDPRHLTRLGLHENSHIIVFVMFFGMLLLAGVLHAQRWVPAPLRFLGLTLANAVMLGGVFLMLHEIEQFIYFQF
jgi:alginate O-acetyltransferase complex protein AlgI